MVQFAKDSTIKDFQDFVMEVYAIPDDRRFEFSELLDQVQRFAMRGLKGIRKGDSAKTVHNLLISFSWFFAMMNRLSINIEDEMWKRFPYVCSYCNSLPCACQAKRPKDRLKVDIDDSKRPHSMHAFQVMFEKIYPSAGRTLEHAGVHFAEEIGEFSEAFWIYHSTKDDKDLDQLCLEAADLLSCYLAIFNSLHVDLAGELAAKYFDSCHECHKAPCICTYVHIRDFE